jgi:hypothetical protein
MMVTTYLELSQYLPGEKEQNKENSVNIACSTAKIQIT